MTNLPKIFKGIGSFLGGFLLMFILNFMLDPNGADMFGALQTIFTNSDIEPTMWFGIIILWVIISVIVPSFYIISGLKEGTEKNPAEIIIAILIFIMGIVFTVKVWFWVEVFASLVGSGLLGALFWTGLILVWVEVILVTPAYMIIKNTN